MVRLTNIDTSQRGSITGQIVEGIQRLVDERELRPDSRLPSIRRFAATHGISRFTVIQAYDRLAAAGYIQSRPGSGFFVGRRVRHDRSDVSGAGPDGPGKVAWFMLRQTGDCEFEHVPGFCWLPPDWLESSGLGRAMRVMSRDGARGFLGGYGDPQGFAPLREDLRRRFAEIGVDASASQILLTNGATGGAELVARYLVRPDDVVLVDDPGPFDAFDRLRALGASVKGVSWTSEGPNLERLEIAARKYSPRLFLTTTIVQNPTGWSMSQGNAFRLLRLAERYGFYIVEDDALGTLHPTPPPRLASMDQLNRVIYISSFSRDLSPMLRVGYLAGHRDLVRDLVELKICAQGTSSAFTERLVHEVLMQGQYRKHLIKLRANLQVARDRAMRGLESIGLAPCGENTHGPYAWMDVPGVADTTPLAEAAIEHGMLLAPGAMFRPDQAPSAKMRFNVAFCQTPATIRLLEMLLDSGTTTDP